MKLRFDSGATKSFMKYSVAEKLNLPFIKTETINTVFGNGSTEVTKYIVSSDIFIGDLKDPIHGTFIILKDLPEDVLLSNEFLFNNEIILDYKNQVVIILDNVIPMLGRTPLHKDEMDRILHKKIFMIDQFKFEKKSAK
ncbi:UBA domain-containing protein Mud1 [Dictyocoela muelleri]|nr:UBA domain-containing protein Mud1 [Dictyocoela muelleri]